MTATEQGLELSLRGTLELVAGAVSEGTAAARALRRKLDAPQMQPVRRVYPSVVTIAGGLGVAWWNGPDAGHMWYVHALVLGGLTPTTVVAGRADVFVSPTDVRALVAASGIAGVGTQDWRDTQPALPVAKFYGKDLWVHEGHDLFVVFSAATNGQQYLANIAIEDIQLGTALDVNTS